MALKVGRRVFAPNPWLTLLALAVFVLLCGLGRWQLGRAEEKRVLWAGFEAGSEPATALPLTFAPVDRYRQVSVTGRYDAARQFLLDNMSHAGQPGYHVLTPLKLDDGRAVLVDRGFVPFGTARRDQAPPIAVGGETRSIKGRMDALPRPAVELPGATAGAWPRVVSFPRMTEVAAALDVTLHPQVLLLDPAAPDGFVRDWRPPGLAPDQHLGYAVQWFGLAATLAAIWLVLSFPKREDAA